MIHGMYGNDERGMPLRKSVLRTQSKGWFHAR